MSDSAPPKHNARDYKIRWSVTLAPIVLFAIIFVSGLAIPELFKKVMDTTVMLVMKDFGWLISLSTLFLVFFCLAFLFIPMGKIRLGGPTSKPELTTFEYFALSLCAGMATGFILWPVAEMIEYSINPAKGTGLASGSYDSIMWALQNEFLHWAFTPYALYTAFGLVVSYAFYNLHRPYAASSILYPLMGDKLGSRTSNFVDSLTLFAIIGGVAGSMGYGLLQLGSGLEFLFGWKTGFWSWLSIATAITIIYTGTSVSGLKNGIAWLSKQNTWLFIFFLVFAIVFGPKSFMFNLTVEAFGKFVANYIPLLTFQNPLPDTDLWPQWWGTIWWLDWVAFAPMTGLFMASLSKGRTLREFVVVNMILPSTFAMIWFGMFGGLAAHAQYVMGEDLAGTLAQHGHQYMQLFSLQYLPLSVLTKPLMLITQMISFITLANAMTSTIAMMCIKTGPDYSSQEAPMKIKIFWGVAMASISLLFLSAGGLDGAKSVKAVTGFPIILLETVAIIGFIRFFMKGQAPEKNLCATNFIYTNFDNQRDSDAAPCLEPQA